MSNSSYRLSIRKNPDFCEKIENIYGVGIINTKVLLTAINSKFIHSSLAVRNIYAYCEKFKEHIVMQEFTINQQEDYILKKIHNEKPDILCFSCYIWNIEIVKRLIAEIRKIMPKTIIVLGGPEVSYNPQEEGLFGADIISCGEGEETFRELLECLISRNLDLNSVAGIIYNENGNFIVSEERKQLSLDQIPFCYKDCIEEFENKIIYYESQRGCPFSCQYCLSSVEKGVRFLSEERVKSDLDYFLSNKVKQVKFVDRTFNCNEKHALLVWQYIIDNDNGITNFHFEISADLLTEKMLDTVQRARKGLIQFEVGVQSTNGNTLNEIQRKTDLDKLFAKVEKVKSFNNIHQHLDLIAGLPEEDFASFKKSFNEVFAVHPDMLQLGFLKLLRGSGLRINAERLGIVYRTSAPYEVLYTKEVSFEEMLSLKAVEEIVELYYNSGNFTNSVEYGIKNYSSPFDFFYDFAQFWESQGYDSISHSKVRLYEILFIFISGIQECDPEFVRDLVKFDLFSNENMKNLPQWLKKTDYSLIKTQLNNFYADEENRRKYFTSIENFEPRQLSKMCHIENFDYRMDLFIDKGIAVKENTYMLFNYHEKEKTAGNAAVYRINL